MNNLNEKALELHEQLAGKISVELKTPIKDKDDLSLVYSPGVAEPCKKIAENKEDVYKYTSKSNTIAVISNGTAVLGLGDIGPEAALPVMEGKACLFKQFGGVNAIPLVVDSKDPEEIIKFVKMVSPGLGGVNLEDIKAPECFEIEERLKAELDIPVFHDDQHGTAIVVLAGLINSLKLIGKTFEECNLVISGVGAAGSSIIKILKNKGIDNIFAFTSKGIINRNENYTNPIYNEIAQITNNKDENLSLEEAMSQADIFVGVSVPDKITAEMVKSMKRDPIIFALANPNPEIDYDLAKEAGARVVGTGRSDYPNQVNNVLAFPGLFRGALQSRSKKITESMKIAAAEGIASLVSDDELSEEYVIPSPFDLKVAEKVAQAVIDVVESEGLNK